MILLWFTAACRQDWLSPIRLAQVTCTFVTFSHMQSRCYLALKASDAEAAQMRGQGPPRWAAGLWCMQPAGDAPLTWRTALAAI